MRPEWLWLIYSLGSWMETNCARLFKGRDAQSGEYPFVVYIERRRAYSQRTCAGTIATLSRVISAGVCFGGLKMWMGQNFTVQGGSVYRIKTAETQTRHTIEVTVHPGFKEIRLGHFIQDIGVGELNKPFEQSPTLAPFKLPFENENEYKQSWFQQVSEKTVCSMIGWGFSKEFNNESEILKVVEFLPKEACGWKTYKIEQEVIGKGEACISNYVLNNTVPNDLHWSEGSGFGMPVMCGDVVYGHSKATSRQRADMYNILLFWPYIEYFNISESFQPFATTTAAIETTIAAGKKTGGTDEDLWRISRETNGGTEPDLWHISGCGNEGGSRLIFPIITLPLIVILPRFG